MTQENALLRLVDSTIFAVQSNQLKLAEERVEELRQMFKDRNSVPRSHLDSSLGSIHELQEDEVEDRDDERQRVVGRLFELRAWSK